MLSGPDACTDACGGREKGFLTDQLGKIVRAMQPGRPAEPISKKAQKLAERSHERYRSPIPRSPSMEQKLERSPLRRLSPDGPQSERLAKQKLAQTEIVQFQQMVEEMYSKTCGWCFILCLGNILALICCLETTRKYPLNYAILFGLTLGNGGLVGLACQLYTAPSIILAVSLTAVTLLSLTLYAAFGGKDLTDITDMSIYLFTGLMVLCFSMFFLSIMQLIGFDLPWVQKVIAVCGTVLFSFYIVFDTQMIMGGYGGHKMEFSLDDYVFAALNLYLDIINLFMYILQIVGSFTRIMLALQNQVGVDLEQKVPMADSSKGLPARGKGILARGKGQQASLVKAPPDEETEELLRFLDGKGGFEIDLGGVGRQIDGFTRKGLPQEDALGLLQEVLDRGPSVKNPTSFIRFKLKARLAVMGVSLDTPVDEHAKLLKRIEWLNDYGGVQKDINYNKVVAALEQVGLESAMRILKDLEDQAAGVADPNEFILSSLKKPVGPTGGASGSSDGGIPKEEPLTSLEALNKFIHFVSKGGRSVQPSEVADALDALGPARVMRILKDMEEHGLGLDDPVSYVKAAAKMSGHLVVKKEVDSFESEDHSVDDVSKLTSRMKWLNEFGGLSKKIAIDEVIGALYCLGLAPSMSILRSLQERGASVADPTRYIKQAVQHANRTMAKDEDEEEDVEVEEEEVEVEVEEEEEESVKAKEEVPADEVEDWLAWAADEEPKLKRQKRMTSGASAGPKVKFEPQEPSVSHPLSPQEKVMQVRSYALKNSLRLDDQCLKTLSRLPCSKATDLIDEVLRGGRNRRGVANPSKYLLRAVQMSCVGLGVEQGLAMELAVSLGLVLNNDALDELASIPRKASHAIIRQLAASPNRVSPMDFICEEVEKCRTQLRWQSQ
ncbi:unnamed protein product [Durusdinium trenchii]|uniref:Uncharacterized protein n=1 Tax=Durusdinium trenchii TaxID=1381693 RepID=A0ABP0IQB1_9DINO